MRKLSNINRKVKAALEIPREVARKNSKNNSYSFWWNVNRKL